MLTLWLTLIFLLVLLGPFLSRRIESNLEAFLFIMGLASAMVSRAWSGALVREGFIAPVDITLAVLVAGGLFHYTRRYLDHAMRRVLITVPLPAVVFAGVVVLGLLSSLISAIIAALLLIELINVLPLHRRAEVHLTIVACFAIGLGAALTPLGEPLATIAVSKLAGPPHHANFLYLLDLLGVYIVAAVLLLGVAGIFLVRRMPEDIEAPLSGEPEPGGIHDVFIRAFKVYIFVMALIFLGAGFKPLIDRYLAGVSSLLLFWLNIVSAILDNATLTAAEIAPSLSEAQIKSALLGLLISGGMLIPGNIPNIIAAHALKIRSTEWARLGVPLGLLLMVATMLLLIAGIV
jgi:predicted cation transporter